MLQSMKVGELHVQLRRFRPSNQGKELMQRQGNYESMRKHLAEQACEQSGENFQM